MTGMETIRAWKSLYKNNLKLLKKEEEHLRKMSESSTSYEIKAAEGRIASVTEELSILERKILRSWIDESR